MTSIPASYDIAAITDRVMARQLLPVERSTAEALVRMVLECANGVPVPELNVVEGTILSISYNARYPHHQSVIFDTGSARLHMLGPNLTEPGGLELDKYLRSLIRKPVVLHTVLDPSISRIRQIIVRVHGVGANQ